MSISTERMETMVGDLAFNPEMKMPGDLTGGDRKTWRALRDQVKGIVDRGDVVDIPPEMTSG